MKGNNVVYTLYQMRHGKTRTQLKRESLILQVSIIRRSQNVVCTLEPLHLAMEIQKLCTSYIEHTFLCMKFKVI
jgi:hypothetical protein